MYDWLIFEVLFFVCDFMLKKSGLHTFFFFLNDISVINKSFDYSSIGYIIPPWKERTDSLWNWWILRKFLVVLYETQYQTRKNHETISLSVKISES